MASAVASAMACARPDTCSCKRLLISVKVLFIVCVSPVVIVACSDGIGSVGSVSFFGCLAVASV